MWCSTLISQTVLQISSCAYFIVFFVFNIERKISENPHELWHKFIQTLLIFPFTDFIVASDLMAQSRDHLKFSQRTFIDGANWIIDKVRGYEKSKGEYFGVVIKIFFQTVTTLSVNEEDIVVSDWVELRFRPNPDSLSATGIRRINLELHR